jgi:nitrate/TMAO reductase-like tetraheme cytochrome c subunit
MVIRLIKRGAGRLRRWASGLSRVWVVGLASVIGIAVIVGSVLMYKAYTFIQHDNEFCNTCHLMSQPFAKFNQSAHRGLGCKACHRPNIIQRSYMGLRAVLKNPKEVGPHAPVSNERCGECHVAGNPQEWKLISNSSGHRVHLNRPTPR